MIKPGLLLLNLGTPSNYTPRVVKRYLTEFLTDKRVIDLPWLLRYLLVYGLIIPFRTQKAAQAYKTIWSEHGSPLLYNSQKLIDELNNTADQPYHIALGMRYGTPSIASALAQLKQCTSIIIIPLYPQYSSAATGSSIEESLQIISARSVIPSLKIIRDFYQHPAYINAQAQMIRTHLPENNHLLFSYHGIPERQINKSGCTKVCTESCPPISEHNAGCYKAQCHQTSTLLAQALCLKPDQYSTAFQSRLGKTPWIKPYTDEVLVELAAQGYKNLTIACPSFVADCLETLEEIAIRAAEQWRTLGGQQFNLVPCMNNAPQWAKAILEIAKQ